MKSAGSKCGVLLAAILTMVCFVVCPDVARAQERAAEGLIPVKSEPLSFSAKINFIEHRFDIWIALVHPDFKDWDEELDPKIRQPLNNAFATRLRERHDAHRKAAVASLTEQREDLHPRAFPKSLLEAITKDSPSLIKMDEDARRQFISEYYERVLEIETEFGEQVDQILSPAEQAKMLRGPANVTSFLVHPIAAIYLNLSAAQQSELRRRYDLFESTKRARMSAIQSHNARSPTGKAVKLLRLPSPDETELSRYYEALAVLSHDQLEDFLRL